jgi:membrane associated rhomboid family serine protease
MTDGTLTPLYPPADGDRSRFGTPTFYAAVGRAFVAMCLFAPVLFLIELVNFLLGGELAAEGGIRPHVVAGLDGVVLSPFLHASFEHVTANSVPLIVLGTFVLAAGVRRFVLSTIFIVVASGLAVWFIGDPRTVVVGASGVIFGYFGLLFMRGLVERSWWNIGVAFLVGLLYGWQLVGVLGPVDAHISWQDHLCGLIAGLIAGVLFRRRRVPPARPAASTPGSGDTITMPLS